MRCRARFWIVSGLLVSLARVGPAAADLGVPVSSVQPLNSDAATDDRSDYFLKLATDGLGHWVAVWRGDENAVGPDDEILFARSLDSGANWSPPAPLNTNFATDTANDSNPAVATDGQGHWVAVWDAAGEILVARSIDNCATWSVPAPLNTDAGSDHRGDDDPNIATDGSGNWVCVWSASGEPASSIGNDRDIFVARSIDNGANWSAPVPLNSDATTDSVRDWHERIATDGSGNWICVWERTSADPGDDDDIFYARSTNNGANWSAPVALNANAAIDSNDDFSPDVACAPGGQCVAVWYAGGLFGPDDDALVARTIDGGANWSLPLPLNINAAIDSGDDSYPSITTDRQGNWVAVWDRTAPGGPSGPDQDIAVARSVDIGAHWSIPQSLNSNAANDSGDDVLPIIASDGRGSWVTIWSSVDTLGGTIGSDDDILVARFALPDCNQNLIGDALETAAGISPDINNNSVPDICDVFPPLPTAGCGGGLCGTGAAAGAQFLMLSIAAARRRKRR